MNKVILTGRFTRDPEIKYTNDGASIARFSIAVDRRFVKEGSDQKADFLNCIAFGKSAEFIEKYFSKGMKADLSGRIQTGSTLIVMDRRYTRQTLSWRRLSLAKAKALTRASRSRRCRVQKQTRMVL